METETRACANCRQPFTIEPDDFSFYEKMRVPAPTWCPWCQMQRRMCFRNERTLHKRKESLRGTEVISGYAPEVEAPIYTQADWWSDVWDPAAYGKPYDFARPFFAQMKDLIRAVPWPALLNWNAVNSDYCVYTTDNKNCYLVFGGDYNENCICSTFNFHTKDSGDLYFVEKGELCYELIYSENCYRVRYGRYVNNCTDCAFMVSCTNCTNCVGCVNLKNASYCILNQQYPKEEYERRVADLHSDTRAGIERFRERFHAFELTVPVRFAEIYHSTRCTGNNIHNGKNCINCFEVYENAEDVKNVIIAGWHLKDARNANHAGHKSELIYDSLITFDNSQNVRFSAAISTSQDIEYSFNCRGSRNLFGCVNLKNKQYCILNVQYSKEEYEALRAKIVEHMGAMPFTDRRGHRYAYGDFFPPELSLFAYNETVAQEYFPLTKEQALAAGYSWRDAGEREYAVTLPAEKVPERIADVPDTVTSEIIGCDHSTSSWQVTHGQCTEQCTKAFRIVPQELLLYRQLGVPLPRLCPSCRHYGRMKLRNPIQLWQRQCACAGSASLASSGQTSSPQGGTASASGAYVNVATHPHGAQPCPNKFETSYSPERPEIVYCEACYQQEVA